MKSQSQYLVERQQQIDRCNELLAEYEAKRLGREKVDSLQALQKEYQSLLTENDILRRGLERLKEQLAGMVPADRLQTAREKISRLEKELQWSEDSRRRQQFEIVRLKREKAILERRYGRREG